MLNYVLLPSLLMPVVKIQVSGLSRAKPPVKLGFARVPGPIKDLTNIGSSTRFAKPVTSLKCDKVQFPAILRPALSEQSVLSMLGLSIAQSSMLVKPPPIT